MLSFELCKKLKEAGYIFKPAPRFDIIGSPTPALELGGGWISATGNMVAFGDGQLYLEPTLSELIEACGGQFYNLTQDPRGWICCAWPNQPNLEDTTAIMNVCTYEKTPEEAVANLYLKLHQE